MIVILLFLPAPQQPTLCQHLHACMWHIRRALSLVILISPFMPAPHRPTLAQHVYACMRRIRQSHCVTPHLRLLALDILHRAKISL